MKNRTAGFTLVEIIIAVAIIGILSAIAAPGLIAWREKARFTGSLQALTADLQRCKMSAIRDNCRCQVILTATDYTIFQDFNQDAVFTGPGDIMIKQEDWQPGYNVLNVTSTNFNNMYFDGRGIVTFQDIVGGATEGVIEINGNGGHQGFVRINMLGRIGQTYQ